MDTYPDLGSCAGCRFFRYCLKFLILTSYDRPKVSCDTVADFYGTPIENLREPCIFEAFVYDL